MRKILRYGSISWDPKKWKKEITWGDPDTHQWRGSKVNEDREEFPNAIEDLHIMFALHSKVSPAKMTVTPIEGDMEPQKLHIANGGYVYVGNGFIYFDTNHEL